MFSKMNENIMEISGRTRLFCLIGSPVSHSGSPVMYNYSFKKLKLDCAYLAFETTLEKTKDMISALRLLNIGGFNVTMPCKAEVMPYLDEVSLGAELIGAVNTVVNQQGKLIGYNTDGIGWLRACLENGVNYRGKTITCFGSGGAATSIQIAAALGEVSKLNIFAINDCFFKNAEQTVEKIKKNVPKCLVSLQDQRDEFALKEALSESDILVNATRVGMNPMEKETLVKDKSLLRPDLAVSDIVYEPRETRLLREAKSMGCKTVRGIDMLLWQGAEAFKLYTGLEMPAYEVKEKFFK